MSFCDEKSIKFGKLCLTYDDYFMITFNILISFFIVVVFYIIKISEEGSNLSVIVNNNFNLLGEGLLNNFYFSSNVQQKSQNTKKKVQTKSAQQIPSILEKSVNNNELKCISCGRSVEVSYQYTINKMVSNI